MEIITITKDISIILTLIFSIISLIKLIMSYINKINEYENTIKINTGIIQNNTKDLKNINKTLLLIIDNQINGINVEELKKEREKLEDYLANK